MGKKIVMILDAFLPDTRVEREARSLVKHGWEVHLWCFGKETKSTSVIDGFCIYTFDPSRMVLKSQAMALDIPLYHFLLKKSIKSFLSRVKPDLIHVHDITVAGLVLELKGKAKVILDLHENRPEIMRYYPHLQKFPGKYLISINRWKAKESAFVNASDHLILVTEEAKADYELFNQDIAVVPNVIEKAEVEKVEFDKEVLQGFQGKFVVVYVGDIGLRRGIFDVLKAVNILKEKIKNLLFVAVGDSSERKYYEAYIDQERLNDYVSLEGFQPHQKLFSYIKRADLAVSPLNRNRHHDTTYANKIFQYMAMGKAQIVSDCTAQANLVGKLAIGLVYKAEDYEELADQILKIYSNSEIQRSFEVNAKMHFEEKYHWEYQEKSLLNLYDSI